MNKIHINALGNPGPCTAQEGNCRFGEHYPTMDAAFDAVAKEMGGAFPLGAIGQEVYVEDAAGDETPLRLGVLNDEARWAYLNGQCMAFAVSLARKKGWQVVGYVCQEENEDFDPELAEEDPDYDEPEFAIILQHAYAKRPDGVLIDIAGEHAPATLFVDETNHEAMEEYTPDEMVSLFTDFLSTQDYETAEAFIEPLLGALKPTPSPTA